MYKLIVLAVVCMTCLACTGLMPQSVLAQNAPVPIEAPATEMDSKEAIRDLTRDFMDQISEERFDAAFNLMSPVSNLGAEQYTNLLTATIEKYPNLLKAYGKSNGYDLLLEVSMGETLVRLVFVDKLETYPVRWDFIFYKSDDQWRLINISWNTRVKELLENTTE